MPGGGIDGSTDYRTVVSEILVKQMGVASTGDVFPGLTGSPLGLVSSAADAATG